MIDVEELAVRLAVGFIVAAVVIGIWRRFRDR